MNLLQRLKNDREGAVAIIFAFLLIPLTFAVGMAVDYGRMVMHQSALQRAVDGAVLAGASQMQGLGNTSVVINAANNYFKKYQSQIPAELTVSPGTPKAFAGKTSSGYNSYNVSMTATGSFRAAFLPVLGISTLNISVSAEAANPLVQPQVTFGPLGSTAADFNSLYMYPVPLDASGNPQYAKFPPVSKMYEAGTNCSSVDQNYSSSSYCNYAFGAKPPAGNDTVLGTIPSNQPLAFLFVNVNSGMSQNPSTQGYGLNGYGARGGDYEAFSSSFLAINQPPTQNASSTDMNSFAGQLVPGASLSQSGAVYPKGTGAKNCALQIMDITGMANTPTSPPYPGQCLSPSDPRSGSQYANQSCDQMAGKTYMYWWNDLGGRPDDYNYKDMYYTLKCVAGSVGNNGGTFSNPAPTTAQFIQLVK